MTNKQFQIQKLYLPACVEIITHRSHILVCILVSTRRICVMFIEYSSSGPLGQNVLKIYHPLQAFFLPDLLVPQSAKTKI